MLGWAWIAVIASVPVQQLVYIETGPAIRYLPVLLGLVCAGLGRFSQYRGLPGTVAFGLLTLAGGLVSGFSTTVVASVTVAAWLALLVALVPGCLLFQVRRSDRFTTLATAGFLLVQSLSALAGVLQSVGVSVLGFTARGGRVNGLAHHPNILGLMAVVAVVVCLGLAVVGRGRRSILIGVVVLNIGVLLLSGSLSALLSLVVGLLCFVAIVRPWKLVLGAGAALATGVAVIGVGGADPRAVLPGVSDRAEEVVGASGEGVASFLVRLDTYGFALDRIAESPVVGTGMDPAGQSTVTSDLVVHMMILRAWMQGGIFLLVAVTGIVVALAIFAVRAAATRELVGAAAVVVVLLVFGMTSTFYNQPHYWLPVLAGVAYLEAQRRSASDRTRGEGARP
ncbi:O-antigen ligase family protein [Litorihabitans aurantiacus]|uniref:O-antigen ligase-related domain-containing protein n=1 Tax=Litorihabitans aurantiacus TaxID=1930061 RepID=A0AA37XDP2_9MICO|nr:O-antigen ligase family protein [Litorihabitans aurantiacus]GMA30392.1 hypothetical protein GCM10025875_03840 [Litorihabitans aurantiacus]